MSHRHSHRKRFQTRLWGAPILLGLISLAGLLSALIGDGWWDVASWLCLGLMVLVCAWFGMWAGRRRQHRR